MKKINVSELIGKAKLNKFHISIFLIVLFIIIADGYDQAMYGVALPTLMQDPQVGIDATGLGLIATYTLWGMFVGSIFFGSIGDRIGRPKTLAIGLVLFCVGNGMFGIVNTEMEFIAWRVIAGFGLAGVVPVALGIVSEYSPDKNRALLTTYVTAGVPLGTIVAPLVGMAVLPEWGWRAMFLTALIPLILVIFVFLFIPESMDRLVGKERWEKIRIILSKAAPTHQPESGDIYETNASKAGKTKVSFLDLFRKGLARNTVLFWIAFICMMFFTYGMSTWLPSIMVQAGYPITSSLVFTLAYSLGSIPGIAVSGIIIGKIGYKKSIVLYTGLAAIAMIALAFSPSEMMMYVLLFLVGWGIYGATALVYTYIALTYPTTIRSTGVGFAAGAGRIGGSIAPLAGGLLATAQVPMAVDFIFFAAFVVVACITLMFTREKIAD